MSRVPIQDMANTKMTLLRDCLRYSSADLLNWMGMNFDPTFNIIMTNPAKNLLPLISRILRCICSKNPGLVTGLGVSKERVEPVGMLFVCFFFIYNILFFYNI